jgi:hypothetical protein
MAVQASALAADVGDAVNRAALISMLTIVDRP